MHSATLIHKLEAYTACRASIVDSMDCRRKSRFSSLISPRTFSSRAGQSFKTAPKCEERGRAWAVTVPSPQQLSSSRGYLISPSHIPGSMDVFGIVYIIENAQQFWSGMIRRSIPRCGPLPAPTELEDILHIPNDLTLEQLDSALRRYISFCACYHGVRYVPAPLVPTDVSRRTIPAGPPSIAAFMRPITSFGVVRFSFGSHV